MARQCPPSPCLRPCRFPRPRRVYIVRQLSGFWCSQHCPAPTMICVRCSISAMLVPYISSQFLLLMPNNRMEHNAASVRQFVYLFACSHFLVVAPHGSCGALEHRATRFGFLMPLRRMRDISVARSFAVIPDQRDFAARFCCTSIS